LQHHELMYLLVWLLVWIIVLSLVWYIVTRLPLPPAAKLVVEVGIALVALVLILGVFGFGWWGPPAHWHHY